MTIVSDDVAPDMVVSALTVPTIGGSGLSIQVTDTTKNQGIGQRGRLDDTLLPLGQWDGRCG